MPRHTATSVNEFLNKKGIPVVLQPPYLPDESVWLLTFPENQIPPQRLSFGTVDNIQKVMTDQLRALPYEDFQHGYREREQRLQRCLASQGNYFKGDNVDL